MADGIEKIQEKIHSFQRRYYLNIFIKGSILTLSIVLFYFLLATLLEDSLWLGHWARLLIFFLFFALVGVCIFKFLKEPLQWWIAKRGLNDEQSAKIIGTKLPAVKDRLLNLLQLISATNSELAYASVKQKSQELEPLSFDSIIDLNYNKRYLKYLAIPAIIFISILFLNQSIITQSTDRIIHFNQQFSPQAPFKFMIKNESLTAFYNEDFTIRLKITGKTLPESVYINNGQLLKMTQANDGEFSYTFENIQKDQNIQFEAAGFFSEQYKINLVNRPELVQFKVNLHFPKYLQRKNESLSNTGNLEIPEGTSVNWSIDAVNTSNVSIRFKSDNQSFNLQSSDNQSFNFEKQFHNPDQYEVVLKNDDSKNKDKITYQIEVIKDEYPKLSVDNFKDSILYKHIILGGNVSDDHGLTQLSLHFRIRDENQKEITSGSSNILISKNQLDQNYFYNWSVDSLKLKSGSELEYYLQVWDNDGINGRKSTKSANYTFQFPTENNLLTQISKSSAQTEQKISQSATKANKLQDQVEQAYQKLKGKQNLDWQDKKMLDDILKQKQKLTETIDQLKQENKLLQEKKNAFTKQDERIKEKAEQIQKLMDQLLDEETKKLFEELEKLMKEKADVSQIEKLLEKLNQNTNNVEKDLDRMLELFKQVEYETKVDITVEKLKQQIEKQKDLLDQTEKLDTKSTKEKNSSDSKDKQSPQTKSEKGDTKGEDKETTSNDKPDNQDLAHKQEQLQEEFKQIKEKIEELKKIGEELDKKDDLPSEEDEKQIEQEQQQSKESLEKNKPSQSKQNQKKALQKMQEMQKGMESMQGSMEMEMDSQNLEALKQIIHGLIKLSFNQENLLKSFNELQQNDPRFIVIAQQQLQLKDDAKVLEDSLIALSKKDPFMGSFVTKEVGELNNHLDKIAEANKERKRPQASSEMQFSMTSINNLALMLDDHFDMMMQMMANAQPSMKKSKGKGKKPSLSQLQQQLNQKIQELKGSGKRGRQLSEDLAGMAAEQEKIREALQEMQKKLKNGGQSPGGDLPSKMEQTEMDLVNKNLTDQMIKRQKDILTRLIQAENSMREQEMDEERKGETAKDVEQTVPKAFEEYLKLKEKEIELLKTVPPKLYPYYKKEVGEYFKRIGDQ